MDYGRGWPSHVPFGLAVTAWGHRNTRDPNRRPSRICTGVRAHRMERSLFTRGAFAPELRRAS